MKITTNFATPKGRLTPYLAGMFLLLGAVALVVSFALFIAARQIAEDVPDLERRLAGYRSHEIQHTTDLLSPGDLADLRARVLRLNQLTSTTGQTLPILFSRLEKLLPDGVWLVTLQYQARESEAKLVAEANQADQLTEFMGRLERSGYFSQVLLTRQSRRAEDAHAIQFEIQLRGKQ